MKFTTKSMRYYIENPLKKLRILFPRNVTSLFSLLMLSLLRKIIKMNKKYKKKLQNRKEIILDKKLSL